MADDKPVETVEETITRLAGAIEAVADLGDKLMKASLSQQAIIILLADLTGQSRRNIRAVLLALPRLRKYVHSNRAKAKK